MFNLFLILFCIYHYFLFATLMQVKVTSLPCVCVCVCVCACASLNTHTLTHFSKFTYVCLIYFLFYFYLSLFFPCRSNSRHYHGRLHPKRQHTSPLRRGSSSQAWMHTTAQRLQTTLIRLLLL